MNILIDILPSTIEIDKKEYEINSDFRASILFELMMQDNDIAEEEKIYRALELYYPNIPKDTNKAIDKILWFYRSGKDVKEGKGNGSNKKTQQIYSFDYDDEYIYSAFLDQYSIDLQDIDYLHWWKFKAMFNSLKNDNKIVEIMGYRAMTITNDMQKEQKEFYRKMKKEYDIPINKNEKEKINAIEEALMNGDDISKIL